MVNEIYADGRLGDIQQTGGAPNYYLPSSSYNFGVGGFLLAGEQVAQLGEHLGQKSRSDASRSLLRTSGPKQRPRIPFKHRLLLIGKQPRLSHLQPR